MGKLRCPTRDCEEIPPEGFTYCKEHAGSERRYYEAVEKSFHKGWEASEAARYERLRNGVRIP